MLLLVLLRIAWGQSHNTHRSPLSFPDVAATLERRQASRKQVKELSEPTSNQWRQARPLLSTMVFDTDVDCATLSDWQRLREPECHKQWANQLRTGKIVDIDMMLGFERGKRNAFRVVFEDGTYGWFKTCPGEGEDPYMEVAGYLIDMLLQFHTMAPVVTRALSVPELEKVARANGRIDFLELIARTDYICGSGDVFNGVMIGWWDNVDKAKSPIKKKGAKQEEVLEVREKWDELLEESYPIAEMPRNHALLYLLNILQHQGHNEFRLKDGPLILIDVDRTQFLVSPKHDIGFGLEYLCKMDLYTYQALQEAVGKETSPDSLGYMLLKALSIVAPEVSYTMEDAKVLQRRLDYLLYIMDNCIKEYGIENVIYEFS